MKIILFVEGKTERKVLPDFLRRWLESKNIKVRVDFKIIPFEGSAEFEKHIHSEVSVLMNSPEKNKILGVIGLLDLFGSSFYKGKKSIKERCEQGKKQIEDNVRQSKFKMFFAVHELEAWLLSQPAIHHSEIRDSIEKISHSPESVDSIKPPAKLLEELYRTAFKYKRRKKYKKLRDGVDLFKKLDPEIAAAKCPHLKEMLTAILEMASAPAA